MIRLLALLPVVVFLSAGERLSFAVANLPADVGSLHVINNIHYGPESWQTLDLYMPKASQSRRATIVFLYGGRWTKGAKSDYRFIAKTFASRGYNVVIPDYAKYPAVKFPAFVEDAAKAVAWTYDHIEAYHGDQRLIHVVGHSAGAHIGALVVADPRYLAAEGKTPRQTIASFAGLAGPYDFTPDEPDLMDMFGPPDRYRYMQVTSFIGGHEPPMLLLWGDADKLVRRFNLDHVKAAVEAKSGAIETKIYHGGDHIGLLSALSWFNSQRLSVLDDLDRFLVAAASEK